jgi:D-amino-acid oxidase
MAPRPRHITVVGAGVVGLTTALEFQRRGHRVTVVAEHVNERTVSAVAGAVWLPFQVGHHDPGQVRTWGHATRAWLRAIADEDPSAGVDVLDIYEIERELAASSSVLPGLGKGDAPLEQAPWWALGIEVERAPAPVVGAPLSWKLRAPRVQPSLFLPWLLRQLEQPVQQRRVHRLQDVEGDAVVNCTGLGAAPLLGDAELQGVFGQVVIAGCGGVDLGVSITDDRDPESLFYVIPRRHELVLGGVVRPVQGTEVPPADPAITARILAHAARLGLAVGEVQAVRVGLRPVRSQLRLERDPAVPHVFHNYGHGGSGFTLCHGTAVAMADLIEDAATGG